VGCVILAVGTASLARRSLAKQGIPSDRDECLAAVLADLVAAADHTFGHNEEGHRLLWRARPVARHPTRGNRPAMTTRYSPPPTPQEIRERAEAVRMTWSEAVRQKREAAPSGPVTIPTAADPAPILAQDDAMTPFPKI